MNSNTVDAYIEKNKAMLFPNDYYSIEDVRQALLKADDNFVNMIQSFSFALPSDGKLAAITGKKMLNYYLTGLKKRSQLFTFHSERKKLFIKYKFKRTKGDSICRAFNCAWIINSVDDPSIAEIRNTLAARQAKVIAKITKWAKIYMALRPGLKEIGSTFYVD